MRAATQSGHLMSITWRSVSYTHLDGSLDFTGAGDSFGAGFMASYVKEQDMYKAALNGNATASLVIQRSGGCTYGRMPSREKVQMRIATGA